MKKTDTQTHEERVKLRDRHTDTQRGSEAKGVKFFLRVSKEDFSWEQVWGVSSTADCLLQPLLGDSEGHTEGRIYKSLFVWFMSQH